MGSAETGDHLADGFATGRAGGQFGCSDGSPEGKLTTTGGAVAVTKFVFVQGHDTLEGTRGGALKRPRISNPTALSNGTDLANLTGFPARAIVETA
jgi:hypothetical protein